LTELQIQLKPTCRSSNFPCKFILLTKQQCMLIGQN